jgi:hypothetical protein
MQEGLILIGSERSHSMARARGPLRCIQIATSSSANTQSLKTKTFAKR